MTTTTTTTTTTLVLKVLTRRSRVVMMAAQNSVAALEARHGGHYDGLSWLDRLAAHLEEPHDLEMNFNKILMRTTLLEQLVCQEEDTAKELQDHEKDHHVPERTVTTAVPGISEAYLKVLGPLNAAQLTSLYDFPGPSRQRLVESQLFGDDGVTGEAASGVEFRHQRGSQEYQTIETTG